jgi:hypothetical protein
MGGRIRVFTGGDPMRIHRFAAATALAAALLPVHAQSMKPGLWEINNKMSGGQMDGAMAEMQKQLAQMPPDQRKQMEAMMAQRGVQMTPGAGGGMAVRMCMTKEMVERNEVPTRDGCTTTKNQRSGNTMKIAFTCTSPPSSGEGDFTFSGDAYTSHMTVKTAVQGKPETMVMDATGKWLGADCGSVKPMAVPKK